jgi:hypothetical protein
MPTFPAEVILILSARVPVLLVLNISAPEFIAPSVQELIALNRLSLPLAMLLLANEITPSALFGLVRFLQGLGRE